MSMQTNLEGRQSSFAVAAEGSSSRWTCWSLIYLDSIAVSRLIGNVLRISRSRNGNLLGGNVTVREEGFKGDVGDDTMFGPIEADEVCMGRTTATGADDCD